MGRKVKDGAGHGYVPNSYVEAEALTSRVTIVGLFMGSVFVQEDRIPELSPHEVDTARQQ